VLGTKGQGSEEGGSGHEVWVTLDSFERFRS
jgi:hypothetical protein